MNDKEYTYDIGKYTIGVDENGKDGIGMTIAIIKNGGINLLGNCYGENARCIDLLIKENQELKKQLEETNRMIEKCGFVNIEQLMLSYCGLIAQQKEFIKWLEYYLNLFDYRDIEEQAGYDMLEEILQKYKEIIGGK